MLVIQIPTVPNFLKFEFGMVCYLNSRGYDYGPCHSKTEPLHRLKKMEAIWLDLKWSGCSDFEWCLKSKPFDNQTGLDSLSTKHVQFSNPRCIQFYVKEVK